MQRTSTKKMTYELLGTAIREATLRGLKHLAALLAKNEKADEAHLCESVSQHSSQLTTENAAKLYALQEKMMTEVDDGIERLGVAFLQANPDAEEVRPLRIGKQAADLLYTLAGLVHQCAEMDVIGMYTLNPKANLSALAVISDAAKLVKLHELNGGPCPCGCGFKGPKEAFGPIRQAMKEAEEAEDKLQDTAINAAMEEHPELMVGANGEWSEGIKPYLQGEREKLRDTRPAADDPDDPMATLQAMLAGGGQRGGGPRVFRIPRG